MNQTKLCMGTSILEYSLPKINSVIECFRENTLHVLQQEGSVGMRRPQVTEMVS